MHNELTQVAFNAARMQGDIIFVIVILSTCAAVLIIAEPLGKCVHSVYKSLTAPKRGAHPSSPAPTSIADDHPKASSGQSWQ